MFCSNLFFLKYIHKGSFRFKIDNDNNDNNDNLKIYKLIYSE